MYNFICLKQAELSIIMSTIQIVPVMKISIPLKCTTQTTIMFVNKSQSWESVTIIKL